MKEYTNTSADFSGAGKANITSAARATTAAGAARAQRYDPRDGRRLRILFFLSSF